VVSFVAGLVFVAVAVVGLTDWTWRFNLDARWLLPVALVAVGVIGVAAVLGRGRQRHD
jgi:hypothetical protein